MNSTGRAQAAYLAAGVLSGLGIVGKANLIHRIIPLPTGLLTTAAFLALGLPFLWPLAVRWRRVIAPLAAVGLLGMFLVVYPRIEEMHKFAGARIRRIVW